MAHWGEPRIDLVLAPCLLAARSGIVTQRGQLPSRCCFLRQSSKRPSLEPPERVASVPLGGPDGLPPRPFWFSILEPPEAPPLELRRSSERPSRPSVGPDDPLGPDVLPSGPPEFIPPAAPEDCAQAGTAAKPTASAKAVASTCGFMIGFSFSKSALEAEVQLSDKDERPTVGEVPHSIGGEIL